MSSLLQTGLLGGRGRLLAAGAAGVVCFFLAASTAGAAVPSVDVGSSSGPLTHVAVGNDLSCQIQHTGDSSLEFFPPSVTPGDCGTFVAVGGTVYGPDFGNHDGTATGSVTGSSYSPVSAVSQSAKTGAGTSSNPFKVVTSANAGGTGLALTETDSYVNGQESYRTDVAVHNGGGGAQSLTLYRAGDCYLQNSDSGFGFSGASNNVGCSANANNSPPGRVEEWFPITGGNNFLEAGYSDVWSAIATQAAFPNQCARCTEQIDNGAGISWTVTIEPGQTMTFSHFTTFSPTGRTGPPPAPPAGRPSLRVRGLATSCATNNFTVRFAVTSSVGVRRVQVFLDGKRVASTGRSSFSLLVNVHRLRIGHHVLRTVVTDAHGTTVSNTRTFRTCSRAARRPARRIAPRFTG